jgi:hypothetical protein
MPRVRRWAPRRTALASALDRAPVRTIRSGRAIRPGWSKHGLAARVGSPNSPQAENRRRTDRRMPPHRSGANRTCQNPPERTETRHRTVLAQFPRVSRCVSRGALSRGSRGSWLSFPDQFVPGPLPPGGEPRSPQRCDLGRCRAVAGRHRARGARLGQTDPETRAATVHDVPRLGNAGGNAGGNVKPRKPREWNHGSWGAELGAGRGPALPEDWRALELAYHGGWSIINR